tara:strand:+ start:300 stop:599 length:300 start_codon:yes stop_codon:yes gene_type:complete
MKPYLGFPSQEEWEEEQRASGDLPKTYKGKPAIFRGEISDREPFKGKEEGIYYLISTGSGYCYYDGVATLDLRFTPNPHNPEVAHMEPCWHSELKESEE